MDVSTIEVAGSDALTQLDLLRRDYRKSGRYPFLIGDNEELERLIEAGGFHNESANEIIRRSLTTDGKELLRSRELQMEAEYEQIQAEYEIDDEYAIDRERLLGEWKGESPEKGSISLHKDILSGKIRDRIYIGIVSIDDAWMVPAITKYGGWNECPHPHEHCAIIRYWQEKCRAEIVGMSGDVIECAVFNPPSTKDAAIALAWEQYWYCRDIVDQGTETICNLASTLLNGNYWYFWWD